jgi:DNA (cytosine-5)-methyltransferase 1
MNGLALCAGIGGIELGIKLVCPSYRTVCYVEREAFCASVLVARMEDKALDKAPVWSDLSTFDVKPWRGFVDIVTAGFPCQPFSPAGKLEREKDPRHIWPEIARIVEECEPSLVFLENVQKEAFREPYRDLRRMGFKVSEMYAASAAEMGAGHIRRRVFVLAYRECGELWDQSGRSSGASWESAAQPQEVSSYPQHQGRVQPQRGEREERRRAGDTAKEILGNATEQSERKSGDEDVPFGHQRNARGQATGTAWWASEPELERLVYGLPDRVERDRALGNAVVPIVAAKAFVELVRKL